MKSINIKHFLLFTIGVISILFASTNLTAGVLFGNIDYDSRLESVQWKKFATTNMGDYYQIQVIDDNGALLWQGPKEARDNNPYVFSSTHSGRSFPQLLFDVDGDGYVELLAPEPQSDVSATSYRKLRWMGEHFESLPSEVLMMPSLGSDFFSWVSREHTEGIWISRFKRVGKNGLVEADVTYLVRDAPLKSGVALLKFVPNGALVHKWIKPLSSRQTYTPNRQPVTKTRRIGTVYGLDPHGDGFLSVRRKPNSKEIGRLYNGNRVEILGRSGKWYKIKDMKSKRIGWSHSNWIRVD